MRILLADEANRCKKTEKQKGDILIAFRFVETMRVDVIKSLIRMRPNVLRAHRFPDRRMQNLTVESNLER